MTTLTNLTLKVWRQDGPDAQGRFETHQIPEISDEAVSYTHLRAHET